MKILVFSDSHGIDRHMLRAAMLEKPFDGLIHLGDIQGSEDNVRSLCDGPTWMVAGNCDYFTDLPDELIAVAGGHRLFLTHGHHYMAGADSYQLLAACARQNGCDIALFGHIHRPVQVREHGVLILNPGSISRPRQENHKASYMVLQLEEGKMPKAEHKYM